MHKTKLIAIYMALTLALTSCCDKTVLHIAKQGIFASGGTVTEPVAGEYAPEKNWLDLPESGDVLPASILLRLYGDDTFITSRTVRADTALAAVVGACDGELSLGVIVDAVAGLLEEVLLVGHIGKVVKLAGGLFNTHSRWGDCRAEIFAAHAGACGAPAETVRRILDSAMTDDMLAILDEVGLRTAVMERVTEKIDDQLSHRPVGEMTAGVLVFSNVHGTLGKTPRADALLARIREEYAV